MSKSELINSVSEDENNGNVESETLDEYFSDFTKLKLYIYKPCVSKESSKENCAGKEWSGSEEDNSRIGNTLYYFAGKYKPMPTHVKSICCLDKNEIRESCFKGILSFVSEIFFSSNLLERR